MTIKITLGDQIYIMLPTFYFASQKLQNKTIISILRMKKGTLISKIDYLIYLNKFNNYKRIPLSIILHFLSTD